MSRFILAASAVALAACSDAPNGVTAPTDAAFRSDVAQNRLAALFAKASPAVLAIGGTVFGDNDEVNHRLVFGVENERVIPAVRTVLAQLGAPGTDYEIRVTAPIYQVATLRDRWRPTQAGIQIHFVNYLCSMGFNADLGSQRSFITASHCTNTQGGVEGTQYYQPLSSVDATVIATEVDDPEYFNFKTDPMCPRGKLCRYSDASRELYSSSSVESTRGAIAKPSGVNDNSLDVPDGSSFTVTEQGDVGKDATVNKVGRTTGWTQGKVTATCVNTNVSGSRIHQLCQTFVDAGVGGGDSGSGVFQITSGNNVKLVGILWGGSSDGSMFVYSPFSAVVKELGALTATQ
ncbi:MAG TPA: hypothetical protein VK494_02335 [Gemmatimonadaceae bacterium]|nr:hypothetical protein [Gemmatimonadaceae bacterium]